MKVVYVPVTIPLNSRTIIAVIMTAILGIITTICIFTNTWYEMKMQRTVPKDSNYDTLELVEIRAGPWRTDTTLCGNHQALNKTVCHERSLVWQECRYKEGHYTSQKGGVVVTRGGKKVIYKNFEGGLNFNWCHSFRWFIASFVLIGAAPFFGLITFFVTFYREKCHGPWALVSSIFLIVGLIIFGSAVEDIKAHEINQLQASLEKGGHTLQIKEGLGAAAVFVILSAILWPVATILTLSLCCCDAKEDEPENPATVQVVTMPSPSKPGQDVPQLPPNVDPNGRPKKDRMGRTDEGMQVDYGADGGGYDRMDGAQEMREQPAPRNNRRAVQYQA